MTNPFRTRIIVPEVRTMCFRQLDTTCSQVFVAEFHCVPSMQDSAACFSAQLLCASENVGRTIKADARMMRVMADLPLLTLGKPTMTLQFSER
jgi:hypothetical protein